MLRLAGGLGSGVGVYCARAGFIGYTPGGKDERFFNAHSYDWQESVSEARSWKKKLVLFMAVVSVVAACAASGLSVSVGGNGSYALIGWLSDKQVFLNNVDGYSLSLPGNARVDFSMADVRTAIYMNGASLYVYRQPCAKATDQNTYIGYSNRSLDSREMVVLDSGSLELNGNRTVYNIWTRRKLSRVEHDLNYYACYDVRVKNDAVYTLYFKCADQETFERVAIPVRDSFRLRKITRQASAAVLGTKGTVPRGELARRAYDALFVDNDSVIWGVFEPGNRPNLSSGENALLHLEETVQFSFPIVLQYTDFSMADGTLAALHASLGENRVMELTIQTTPQEQGLMLLDVLDGKYDDYLTSYAREVASWDTAVLFRPANEMNGDWCSYCAFQFGRDTDLYVAFYRYIFDIFAREGADNCIWVWNPNHRSYPNFKWNDERMYYPGDRYVNVVGITAYNTGTYYQAETWQTFDELYRDYYADVCARYVQPLMITEFACSSNGGDKAAWIKDMFARLPDYPRIKAAVWWSGSDYDNKGNVARPYWMDETEATAAAMREGLANYAGGSIGG